MSESPQVAEIGAVRMGLAQWNKKYLRHLCALANSWGGILAIGEDAAAPNGLRQAHKVRTLLEGDLPNAWDQDRLEFKIIPKPNVSGSVLEVHISPLPHDKSPDCDSKPNLWSLEGRTFVWLDGMQAVDPQDWLEFWQRFSRKFFHESAQVLHPQASENSKPAWEQIQGQWDLWLEQKYPPLVWGNLRLRQSRDGTPTLERTDLNETYHSTAGARVEALHVFIASGLEYAIKGKTQPFQMRILEVGLGTGLNACLTFEWWMRQNLKGASLFYTGLEPYPIPEVFWPSLVQGFGVDAEIFGAVHQAPWNQAQDLKGISLYKAQSTLQDWLEQDLLDNEKYDLVYFDAFAPSKQADVWAQELLGALSRMMQKGGVLVTYCSQSAFQNALTNTGWQVEILPGPPGKRQMVRAFWHPSAD
jgi:tRNA U34 5-methylaminomethyl-2-thiouridine-forming methyltransferase MnmC